VSNAFQRYNPDIRVGQLMSAANERW